MLIAFATSLVLAAGGCQKEAEPAGLTGEEPHSGESDGARGVQSQLKPVNPNDSAVAQEAARVAAIAAMRRGEPPPPPAIKLRGGEPATPEVLAAYNQELLRVRIQERRSPENLQELVEKYIQKWRLLPNLPKPPPGKRILYDEVNCIIRLDPP